MTIINEECETYDSKWQACVSCNLGIGPPGQLSDSDSLPSSSWTGTPVSSEEIDNLELNTNVFAHNSTAAPYHTQQHPASNPTMGCDLTKLWRIRAGSSLRVGGMRNMISSLDMQTGSQGFVAF